jgi:hypothetical protein
MQRTIKLAATAAAVVVLAGCASVNFDQAVTEANQATPGFSQGKLELSRTEQQRERRAKLSEELLANPLSMDDAVQLALANSPSLQALLADSWAEMAAASQGGRIANPVFTFERLRLGSELEIGRLLSIGLLDVLTLPQRQSIARNQVAQAKVQLSAMVVEQVSQVRQAWVRAVAAQQLLQYAQQVHQSALGACSRWATSPSCSVPASRFSMQMPLHSLRLRNTRRSPPARSWCACLA